MSSLHPLTALGTVAHKAVILHPDAEVRRSQAAEAGSMLLDRQAAAVRVPGFFTAHRCRQLLTQLREVQRDGIHSPNLDSDLLTLGVTQGSHATRGRDEYFRNVDMWASDPAFISATGPVSPLVRDVHAFLHDAFGNPVELGTEGGRALWPAVIRSIDYVGPHVDDVGNGGWDIGALQNQFAWNVYLAMGEEGGETVVYDRGLNSSQDLRSVSKVTLRPSVGDLIALNTQLVHEVIHSKPAKKRITANGMFSVIPGKRTVTWG